MSVRVTSMLEAGRPETVLRTWQVIGGFLASWLSGGRREVIVVGRFKLIGEQDFEAR